jgi:hypothetical protein
VAPNENPPPPLVAFWFAAGFDGVAPNENPPPPLLLAGAGVANGFPLPPKLAAPPNMIEVEKNSQMPQSLVARNGYGTAKR